jgi:hypothetical protein
LLDVSFNLITDPELVPEPLNRALGIAECGGLTRIDLGTVSLKREPSAQIFVISPEFLLPKCAVVTLENIDAVIARLIVNGCEDSTWHGASDETPDDFVNR